MGEGDRMNFAGPGAMGVTPGVSSSIHSGVPAGGENLDLGVVDPWNDMILHREASSTYR
jgi:hypothetical protein